MENDILQTQKSKKFNPLTLLTILGCIAIVGGIAAIILSKGVNFVTPLLMTPGPTNTMIEPTIEVAQSLQQPGILGELKAVEIEASNFKYIPSGIEVNQGDTVQINFKSTQGMHNLTIEGYNLSTKTIQAGETDQLTFVADKKGTFNIYCSVGNHRAMGMAGVLIVH